MAGASICIPPYAPIGMKIERKQMELNNTIFIFIFLCGSRNEYRNKYENR
jgi:hypothetical protein